MLISFVIANATFLAVGMVCSSGNAATTDGISSVGRLLIVWVKMISPPEFTFIPIIYNLIISTISIPSLLSRLYPTLTTVLEFLYQKVYEMSVPNQIKPADSTDDSNAIVRPHTYEMRQYPHDGILQQLAFMLIRPPRFVYNPDILLPSKRTAQRFQVQTLWVPFEVTFYRQKEMEYVLLYMHGNGSSCFEGTLFLNYLPDRVGLACFDFKGCGNRPQGDFITLGQEQCKDVDLVAVQLKQLGHRVVGWGRSMGGVSLLTSEQCDIMVSDSAYANLGELCKESSAKYLPKACCCLFHCLFPCVFACIQCKVNSLAGLSIDRMDIAARVETLSPSKQICFIHGEADTLVSSHHAEKLYAAFKGRKELILFQGTHNSIRPKEVMQKCFDFIGEALKRMKNTSKINYKLTEMMVELPSLPASKQQPQRLQLLQHSPIQHQRQLLSPINKYPHSHQIIPYKEKDQLEQYCEIGPEGKLPINDTFPELFQKISRKSEQERQKLQLGMAERPCL